MNLNAVGGAANNYLPIIAPTAEALLIAHKLSADGPKALECGGLTPPFPARLDVPVVDRSEKRGSLPKGDGLLARRHFCPVKPGQAKRTSASSVEPPHSKAFGAFKR